MSEARSIGDGILIGRGIGCSAVSAPARWASFTSAAVVDGLKGGDEAAVDSYTLLRLVQIFVGIAQAVGYAHDQGVVHRDLKPANVMLGEHGEVQVLDWGLAIVLDRSGAADKGVGLGVPIGTPAYMSPEQARGEIVDGRSDIYSLGVMLYELLTLSRPFRGDGMKELLRQVRDSAPESPRLRAPERAVPRALEETALRAMEKDPTERQQTVAELLEEIQAWLEAAADAERRRGVATELVAEGRRYFTESQRLEVELHDAARAVEETGERFEAWRSIEEKAELFAAEERRDLAEERLSHASARALTTFHQALGFSGDHADAREALADYYWNRFQSADEARDRREASYFAELVSTYHDGKYQRQLVGDGSLNLTSEPPGAAVRLYRLREEKLRLVTGEVAHAGTTPVRLESLAMGSYVAMLSCEGFRDLTYPVYIARNHDWIGSATFPAEEVLGDEFVHVPGGPFLAGGDARTSNSLTSTTEVIDDFLVARYPVTVADYLVFLNDLAVSDLEAAARRGPRHAADASTFLRQTDERQFVLPEGAHDLVVSRLDVPVVGVSYDDAVAYCAWRSGRDGRAYRLLTDLEWEKAARGVDGRYFPWGNRFDPSLCNMRESRREGPRLAGIDEFPSDRSIYGVSGLAGNVRTWTSTAGPGGDPDAASSRIVRGGAWAYGRSGTRSANRHWYRPSSVRDGDGFRLALSLPRK